MTLFAYKARGKHGDAVEGTLEAVSSDQVATELMENDLLPITIIAANESLNRDIHWRQWFPERVRDVDLIQFSRQMYSLIKAGVPILSALTGLARSTRNATLQATIRDISNSLQAGRDMATAFSEHPSIFNVYYVSMIRVGETSGRLDAIFQQLAQFLERDKRTREQIKTAMRYPLFVLFAIGIALGVINLFVIPAFAKVFSHYHAALPWATQVLLAVSNFTIHYWPHLLVGMVGGAIWLRRYLQTERGRLLWDQKKIRLPVLGDLMHRTLMVRFSRLFAMSSSAGVPLITALTVVARAIGNTYIEARILGMQSGIERGESIARTATASGMFDSLVLQMITVGEESGSLDELLNEVADYYELEVGYEIDRLSAAIEPIMTVAIGIIVLIMALGVFLPMWNISSVALGK